MRLLLWVLLVALVTLLTSAVADSSTIANADTTKTSNLESIQAPALTTRLLSPEYIAGGKRSLRVHDNDVATTDDYDDEERTISIAFNRMRSAAGKVAKRIADPVMTRLKTYMDTEAMALYKLGETPVSLETKFLGTGTNNNDIAYYKEWYDKNVVAGVTKALN